MKANWFARQDSEVWILLSGGMVIALILALWFAAVYYDQKAWDAFSTAHECRIVGEVSGSVGVGVGVTANGQVGTVTTWTAGKTGYSCNDGVTYWR